MESQVQRKSRDELVKSYPIENLATGWFFRLDEESPSQYIAAGSDHWGRQVSRAGSDPQQTLADCVGDALKIIAEVNC